MAPSLRLNAVAFISPQNHPILIRTFIKQHEYAIKYHYIAHTSLDIVEERGKLLACKNIAIDDSSEYWWEVY